MRRANSHVDWSEERKQQYSQLQRELTSNRIWVTNGTEDKYITKDSSIPEGFKRGRCKVGKNHKIVSIEFITKPCKVYDLEIEDNHNFALTAGIIVHNSHKDLSDAVCGSIWSCANSTKLLNSGRVARKVLGSGNITYSPEVSKAIEIQEFETIKQNMAKMFKGL